MLLEGWLLMAVHCLRSLLLLSLPPSHPSGHRPQQLWGMQLGPLDTPAQRLAACGALLATRTLEW